MRGGAVRLPVIAAALAVAAACSSGRPFLVRGDAVSAEIGFGDDIAATLPLARQHCAQYERVPELVGRSSNTAFYDCRRR